jgi:hypothetical protein
MLRGGRPRATSAWTRATPARPVVSGWKSPSSQTGSRRVNHVESVTWEISSSSWMAEMPPPTTMTCWPANSAADT